MTARPLLYGPAGDVVALQLSPDEEYRAKSEALLAECWGILNDVPSVQARAMDAGGAAVYIEQICELIRTTLTHEKLEHILGTRLQRAELGPSADEETAARTLDQVLETPGLRRVK